MWWNFYSVCAKQKYETIFSIILDGFKLEVWRNFYGEGENCESMKGFLEVISVDFLCQSWVSIHGNPGLLILPSISRLCTRINYMHFWVRHIYKSVSCILPPSALHTFKQQLCRPQILYYIPGATCPIPYISRTCHRLQQRLYMNTRGQPELQIY